jgi:pyruvate dehydrogenase E2 component (dihydrolipoamide acetyltransferase)
MWNIEHGPGHPVCSFRKIAVGSWRHPRDPSSYASLDLDLRPAREFLAQVPSATPVTVTHFAIKVLAFCIHRQPELNQVLLRNAFYPRRQVDLFFSVLVREDRNLGLSGFVLRDVPALSLPDVADTFTRELTRLRQGQREDVARVVRRMQHLPAFMIRPFFRLMEFIQYTLNWAPASLRIPQDRLGSAVVTDIGALGLQNAFVPLPAFARCPLVLCIGKPHEAPRVEHGQLIVAPQATLTFTMDHRYIDGAQSARGIKRFQQVFEAPREHPEAFAAESTR